MKVKSTIILGLLTALSFSAPSTAADAALGEKVFRKCKACHSMEAGKRMIGPSLAGVFGRTAGGLEGYKYSKGMLAYGQVWNDDTMAAYLKAPRKVVRGTKMAFAGLRNPADIENLIAYLKANGG